MDEHTGNVVGLVSRITRGMKRGLTLNETKKRIYCKLAANYRRALVAARRRAQRAEAYWMKNGWKVTQLEAQVAALREALEACECGCEDLGGPREYRCPRCRVLSAERREGI